MYLTHCCPFLSVLNTKGSSSDSELLPTGGLTPTLPSPPLSFFSLHILFSWPFSLPLSFSLCFSGTTYSISDLGGLWMWLSGFPRATLSKPNNLSPAGSPGTRFWCWAGGHGGCEGRRLGGVWSHRRKHLSLDHHVQSSPGSLFVGECLLHTGCAYCIHNHLTFLKGVIRQGDRNMTIT